MKKYIFADTNIFMEFRVGDIDWCSLVGADEVELLVCSVVLSELDEHKYSDNAKKKRKAENGSRTFQRMQEAEGSKKSGSKTTCRVIAEAPDIHVDFAAQGLSYRSGDDRLVGAVLAFQKLNPGQHVVIATNDNNLWFKAENRQIDKVRPPSAFQLPPETDARDEELRQLRADNALLAARVPKLKLLFGTEEDHLSIKLAVIGPRSAKEIEREIQLIRQDLDHGLAAHGYLTAGIVGAVSDRQAGSDREEVEEYVRDYRKYLQAPEERMQAESIAFDLDLLLINIGKIGAEAVDIVIRVPDSVGIGEHYPWPDLPPAPEPPVPPIGPERVARFIRQAVSPDLPKGSLRGVRPDLLALPAYFSRDAEAGTVKIHVNRVNPGDPRRLPTVKAWFHRREGVRGFRLQARITGPSLLQPVEGNLDVRILEDPGP